MLTIRRIIALATAVSRPWRSVNELCSSGADRLRGVLPAGRCLAGLVLIVALVAPGPAFAEHSGRTYLIDVEDFDGKAGDEILVADFDGNGRTFELRLLGASSGRPRWAHEVNGALPVGFSAYGSEVRGRVIEITDLSGNRRPEVAVIDSVGPGAAPSVDAGAAPALRVSVLDGKGGAVRWTQALIIPIVNVGGVFAGGVATRIQEMPDADGDGRRDLFVSLFSGFFVGFLHYAYTQTRSWVLSGATGEVVASIPPRRISPWTDRWADTPTRDLSGDGAPDLIQLRESCGGGLFPKAQVHAVSLQGDTHWHTACWNAGVIAAELDGDPGPEFLAGGRALDGADGSVLWRHKGGVRQVGDVNGDGIDDFVSSGENRRGSWIEVWSGRDAGRIWRRNWKPSTAVGVRQVSLHYPKELRCCEDLTGDGAHDVVFHVYKDGGRPKTVALDGRDGSVLWRWPVVGSARAPHPLAAGGDINGNGTRDLLKTVPDQQWDPDYETPAPIRIVYYEGSTGVRLWSHSIPMPAREWALHLAFANRGRERAPLAIAAVNGFFNDTHYSACKIHAFTSNGTLWRHPTC